MVETISINSLFAGSSSPSAIYAGSTKVYKIYAGSTVVWLITTAEDGGGDDDDDDPDTPETIITYSTPKLESLTYNDVQANGYGSRVVVNYSQVKTSTTGDDVVEETIEGHVVASTFECTATEGIDAGRDEENNALYATNCGKVETERRLVATITSVTYTATANNMTVTEEVSAEVYQEANVAKTTVSGGGCSISTDITAIAHTGGTINVTGKCEQGVNTVWTSGEEESDIVKLNVIIECTTKNAKFGNETSTTVASGESAAATVELNQGSTSRTITFKGQSEDGTYSSQEVSVVQSSEGYVLDHNTPVGDFTAAAGSGYCLVTSTHNYLPLEIPSENAVSNDTWITVDGIEEYGADDGVYVVKFSYEKNDSTESRTGTITVTQPGSEGLVTITIVLDADVTSDYYTNPVVTFLNYSDVKANGIGDSIIIVYDQKKVHTSIANGNSETDVSSYTFPTAVSIDTVINGSGYDLGSQALYGPDCAKNETDRRVISAIKSVTFVANDIEVTYECEENVYQEANIKSITKSDHTVGLTADKDTLTNLGGVVTVTPTSSKVDSISYTSGATDTITSNPSITITSNGMATFTGGASVTASSGSNVTATVGINDGKDLRTIVITATVGETSKSVNIVQAGAEYVFTNLTPVYEGTGSGFSGYCRVQSTKNGSALPFTISNVSSDSDWLTISGVGNWNSAGEYIVEYTAAANPNDSSRIATITVTQPETGNTVTFKVTQDGAVYELSLASLVSNAPAEGGDGSFIVQSTKNGNAHVISKSNISLLGVDGATVSVSQYAEDTTMFTIEVTLPENTTAEIRYCTVTVTQPNSGKNVTTKISQASVLVDSTIDVSIKGVLRLGRVSYTLTVGEGTSLDSVTISTSSSSSLNETIYGSTTLTDITSGTYTGVLKATIDTNSVWILVVYNNMIIASSMCMTSIINDELTPIE